MFDKNKINTIEADSDQTRSILETRNLTKYYRAPLHFSKTKRKRFAAVKDISISVGVQDFVALVGGSGAGKSTVAKMILGLIKPDFGSVLYRGTSFGSLGRMGFKGFRKGCQTVFQDPKAALSPRKRVADLMEEPLLVHDQCNGTQRRDLTLDMLEKVGLGAEHLDRLPHELSGGQAQRVCIARALMSDPQLLICDEPTANLDVFTESEIMRLIDELMTMKRLSLLFITHNISLVRRNAKKVAVMYAGRLVEIGDAKQVMTRSFHPYTKYLISFSDLQTDTDLEQSTGMTDSAIDENPVEGCDFLPLCQYASKQCHTEEPHLVEIEAGHKVSCWHDAKR